MNKTKLLKLFLLGKDESKIYYQKNIIEDRMNFLNSISSEKVKFIFPVKAFPHKDILEKAASKLYGFDISNPNEYNLVKSFQSDLIWNSSPFPLVQFANNKIIHDLNSKFDLENMKEKFQNYAIRINTDHVNEDLSHHSRFGINSSDLQDCSYIHYHSGTEKNQVDTYLKMIDEIVALNLKDLKVLNLGGGFTHLEKEDILELIQKIEKQNFPFLILFEPGRWITNNSGVALGRVKNYTHNSGKDYIITTLSRDCHLRWLNKIKVSFHRSLAKEELLAKVKEVKITGPTCYEGDIITEVSMSEKIDIFYNDVIMISNVSGYSFAWNTSFNGIDKVKIELLN
jgi:diaminopimelate decarboxylase